MKRFNLDHLPNYKKIVESQPHIVNSDFEPIIIKNVLTPDNINNIIQEMDSYPSDKIRVQTWGGQANYDGFKLTKDIEDKITWMMNTNLGDEFEIYSYTVVRYTNKHGFKVKLFPHYDTRPSEMFVFDLQLKTNEDWGIFVEGEQFNLRDNEALIFSGTQQMHWRENKELSNDAEINMILFWFTYKNDRKTNKEHAELMKERESALMKDTLIKSNPVSNEGQIFEDSSSFPDYSNLPEYKVLRKKQLEENKIIPDENLEPFLFTNVLTDEELIYIKQRFDTHPKNKIRVQEWLGQGVLDESDSKYPSPIISEYIIKKIENIASKRYGQELEVVEAGPTRYSNDYGWEVKLPPHYDTRPIEMLVFDLQVSSNFRWDIVVEGKKYNLENNQAVMFHGTNQIHWRENKQFTDDAEVNVVFFWLKHKDQKYVGKEHNEIMKEREMFLIKDTKMSFKAKSISNKSKEYPHFAHQSSTTGKANLSHNEIYSNIFSPEEINMIYDCVKNDVAQRSQVVSIYAQKAWFVDMPQVIKDKVTSRMMHIHNQPVKLEEISFARYSNEYGKFPVLTPHFDNTFKEPRVTFDVQLKSNISWPIVVEGKSFTLKDNEAITFSGTNQVHWREHINFNDGDFIEMLFCHFSLEEKKAITFDEMSEVVKQLVYHSNRFSMDLIKKNKELDNKIRKLNNE